MNHLMCQLALYAIADPESPDYDRARVRAIEEAAIKIAATAALD